MRTPQRIVLCIGLVVLALSAMFPPRIRTAPRWLRRIDTAFLYTHSVPVPGRPNVTTGVPRIDFERMIAEWVAIGALTGTAAMMTSFVVGMASFVMAARRRSEGHCVRCGYDLTGNESGVCPECGERT